VARAVKRGRENFLAKRASGDDLVLVVHATVEDKIYLASIKSFSSHISAVDSDRQTSTDTCMKLAGTFHNFLTRQLQRIAFHCLTQSH
jgi:ActR/RegA family two-component response regulator